MRDDLEELVDETIYKHFLETKPGLVAAIDALLRYPQTPEEVEAYMATRITDEQMLRNIGHIAHHLERIRKEAG